MKTIVEDNKIVEAKHACILSSAKILGHFREVSYDEAIDEAAKILANSKRPLLYGWVSASCEVHEKGIMKKTCQVPH